MEPTLIFLPEKSHGQSSLPGYSPWGHKESDMTEQLSKHIRGGRKADQRPLCVPLSLRGPANFFFFNLFAFLSMPIASLPFKVPNHCPQYPLFSLAEYGIEVRISAIWVS